MVSRIVAKAGLARILRRRLRWVTHVPFIGRAVATFVQMMAPTGRVGNAQFRTSREYWIDRYKTGGNSGDGSYRHLARFKAEVLNSFVEANEVSSVIEFGSGDGAQVALASYPDYLGVDVSSDAVGICRKKFSGVRGRKFIELDEYSSETAELSISLDVIYHLVEDDVYERYMEMLFDASTHYVVIYSSDFDERLAPHVRHREFSRWVSEFRSEFSLLEQIPNRYPYEPGVAGTSFADFYVYEKKVS